jgi:hypothetical protein
MTALDDHATGLMPDVTFCTAIGMHSTRGDLMPCTLELGHSGAHEYVGDDGIILARWTSANTEPIET